MSFEEKTSETESVFVQESAAGNEREAALCLHGVESHSGWFEELARHLNQRRIACVAYDRTGWGRSGGRRGHLASYRQALQEVVEQAGRLRQRYARVHLVGLSWGGLLAAYAFLRRWPLFDTVTLLAPGIKPRVDLPVWTRAAVFGDLIGGQGEREISLPIRTEDFTRDRKRTEWIKRDPHRTTRVTTAFCLETLKMRRFVEEALEGMGKRRLPPIQILLAAEDKIIDNRATADLFSGFPAETVKTIPQTIHSLVFEAPERVAEEIERGSRNATSRPKPRIFILGAGAVGSFVGGLIAIGGGEVSLFGRAKQAELLQEEGLRLTIGEGERVVREGISFHYTAPAKAVEPADLCLVAVKGGDTQEAFAAGTDWIGDQTILLSLQNGIDNERRIAELRPRNPILAGAICAYLEMQGPNAVSWAGEPGGLAFGSGEAANREVELRDRVEEWLGLSGLPVLQAQGPVGGRRVKWSKLMLNLAFNALNAKTGLSPAEILAHPEWGGLATGALQEGFRVMRGQGLVPIDLPGYPVSRLARLCRLPTGWARRILAFWLARKNEQTRASSMRQDVMRGKGRTEIEELNGAIVREGLRMGVKTPANQALCALFSSSS